MSRHFRILVVDDEEAMRESLAAWLKRDGYPVEMAESGPKALEALAGDNGFDLVLADIKMPEMDGLELLARIRERDPDILVIMITAYGSIETAVSAMKHGAADYLLKPFDPEQLSLLIERTQAHKAVLEENQALKEQLAQRREGVFEDLVAGSEAMAKVFDLIEDVAATDTPVLITGETGTGKELVARAVHARSGRAFGPFVAINCGAQTESLLESELFGHERGAFTGAVAARRGAPRDGRHGQPLSGRGGRDPLQDAGGSAAGPGGEGLLPDRRLGEGGDRLPLDLRHPPRPPDPDQIRPLPPGFLLPDQRHLHPGPAASGA